MAREVVFSATKYLDYDFLYGESNNDIKDFIPKLSEDVANFAFSNSTEKVSSVLVVKNFEHSCLFGAVVNVKACADEGLVGKEFATRIRGGNDNYPVFTFIGWLIENDSKEIGDKKYIDIELDFVVDRLKTAFGKLFFSNKRSTCSVELQLPRNAYFQREMLPYSEMLVSKKDQMLNVRKDENYFVFNMLLNYALSSGSSDFSAIVGLSYGVEYCKKVIALEDDIQEKWICKQKMSWFWQFWNVIKRTDGAKITMPAKLIILSVARRNTYLFEKFIAEVSCFANSKGIKVLKKQMVVEYFTKKGAAKVDGLQSYDIDVLNKVNNKEKLSTELEYFYLPFLVGNKYITVIENQIILTKRGANYLTNYKI